MSVVSLSMSVSHLILVNNMVNRFQCIEMSTVQNVHVSIDVHYHVVSEESSGGSCRHRHKAEMKSNEKTLFLYADPFGYGSGAHLRQQVLFEPRCAPHTEHLHLLAGVRTMHFSSM